MEIIENHLVHSLLIAKVHKNEIFQQITVNTNEIYQLDFLKVCFMLLYEKSNEWILLQSTLFMVFYH